MISKSLAVFGKLVPDLLPDYLKCTTEYIETPFRHRAPWKPIVQDS